MPDKQLWTTKEVANYLGLGVHTVRAMARRGEIPVYRPLERHMHFDPEEIQAWLKTRTEIKPRDTWKGRERQ